MAIAAIFASCKEEGNGRLDPNAMVSIRAAKIPNAVQTAETRDGHLSAREIVEAAHALAFTNKRFIPDADELSRGFGDHQRDLVNERLMMFGTDVISWPQGELNDDFIGGENVIVRRSISIPKGIVDTIAYIPNATLRAGEAAIREAYAKEDYAAVYKLFDTAYSFLPITGAEWEELKKQGLN